MKKLFVAVVLFWQSVFAFAFQTPFEIIAAASCMHDLNRWFYINEYTAQFGNPYKEEGEALWFRVNTGIQLYDSRIRELFVSTSKEFLFVGVVLEDAPPIVIERIKTSRVLPTNIFQNGNNGWVGADNRQIMWHAGRYTKIFCMAGKNRSYLN